MVRPLKGSKGQGLGQSLGAKLPGPEGNLWAESTTQPRIREWDSDAELPSPQDNPQVEV